jgi:hypothetical protein
VRNLVSHTKGRTLIENRMLMRIFGPKRKEGRKEGGWRRLRNEKLHTL